METIFLFLGKPLDSLQTLDGPVGFLDPWFQLASRLSSWAIQGREYFQKDLSFSRGPSFFDRAVETPFAGLASARPMMKPDLGLCFCYSFRGLWSGSLDQNTELRPRFALAVPHWRVHDGLDALRFVPDRLIHSSRAFGRCENFSRRINSSSFFRYLFEHSRQLLDSCLWRKYIDLDTCFMRLSLPRVDFHKRLLARCWFACAYYLL